MSRENHVPRKGDEDDCRICGGAAAHWWRVEDARERIPAPPADLVGAGLCDDCYYDTAREFEDWDPIHGFYGPKDKFLDGRIRASDARRSAS